MIGYWQRVDGTSHRLPEELDLHPSGDTTKKSRRYEIDGNGGWYISGGMFVYYTCFSDIAYTYRLDGDRLSLVGVGMTEGERLAYRRVSREPRYMTKAEEDELDRLLTMPGIERATE